MSTQNAMLVTLHISVFDARRYDEKVSKDVARRHHAPDKIGRYNKWLIDPDAPSFRAVKQAAQEARDYHYEHTLPWIHQGAQILPAEEYFNYSSDMQEHKSRVLDAAQRFIEDWPRLKDEARSTLNGLYRESDYPAIEELRRRFRFEVSFLPMPDSDDFRVRLGEAEVARVREQIEEQLRTAFAEANRDLWRRLHEVVARMAERLSDPDGRFTSTLVSNVRDLVDLLPRLNFTRDPNLEAIRQQVEKQLTQHGPETLREDKAVRAEVAAKAQAIMAQMAAYMRS